MGVLEKNMGNNRRLRDVKGKIKNRCQEADGLQPEMLTLGFGLTLSQMLIVFFSLCSPVRGNKGQWGAEPEKEKGVAMCKILR